MVAWSISARLHGITFSIFEANYIVGSLALRMEMPARRIDSVAYNVALVGLMGMVS